MPSLPGRAVQSFRRGRLGRIRAPSEDEIRDDAGRLRELADITIETDAISPDDWQDLIATLTDQTQEIGRIIQQQQAYLTT